MKRKHSLRLVAPVIVLGLAMAMPAFAQEESAHDAMHSAGENMKQAGSDTAAAAEDAYNGTKIAVEDTTTSAKVKHALHDDQMVGKADIHVSTNSGVVTLKGKVPSRDAAVHAANVAEHTEGVRKVKNELMVISSARTD